MNSIKIFIALSCLSLVWLATDASVNRKSIAPVAPGKGFALVELFTSEGCSSCPPADALVARIQKESADQPVYILAFHVDYWNRLGWKDVFSSHEFSDRQRQYAQWLNLSSVYTPQAIVNGRTEMVGSQEGTLRNAIKAAVEKPAKNQLSLNSVKVDGDKASIRYHAEGATNNSALLIALIEKNATTKVQRGENGGRTLSHVQIVSGLQSISLKNDVNGSETIALPHGFDPARWELIGFIQNLTNGEITGAAKVQFPPNVSAKL